MSDRDKRIAAIREAIKRYEKWGQMSYHALSEFAFLLDELAKADARIAELEAKNG